MREHLTAEIKKRQTELQGIDQRRIVIDVELSLLRELLAKLDKQGTIRVAGATQSSDSFRPAADTQKARLPAGSNFSPRWSSVLRAAIVAHPRPLTNDEVKRVQIAANQDPGTSSQIRAHVWSGAKAGLYEKVGRGRFRATQAAAVALGIPLGSIEFTKEDAA